MSLLVDLDLLITFYPSIKIIVTIRYKHESIINAKKHVYLWYWYNLQLTLIFWTMTIMKQKSLKLSGHKRLFWYYLFCDCGSYDEAYTVMKKILMTSFNKGKK